MRKIVNYILLLVAGLTFFTACQREEIDYGKKKPASREMVDFHMKSLLKASVETDIPSYVHKTRAYTRDFDFRNFDVTLFSSDNKVVGTYKYDNLPEVISLAEGKYYVKMASPDIQPITETAVYEGKSDEFTITKESVSEVEVKCKMTSIKVKAEVEAQLKKFLDSDVKVTLGIGLNQKEMPYNDLKVLYFNQLMQENNIVNVTLSGTIDGSAETYTKSYNAQKGEYLLIKIGVKDVSDKVLEENGTANIQVVPNFIVTRTMINGKITVDEETIPETPDKPIGGGGTDPSGEETNVITIAGKDFSIDEPQTVVAGMSCVVNINAEKGLAHLKVTINSTTLTDKILTDVGLAKSFDLAEPGGLREGIEGLGLPVAESVINQKSLKFDLTQFMPLLGIYGAGTHKFIITAIDKENNELTKTLTLITDKK